MIDMPQLTLIIHLIPVIRLLIAVYLLVNMIVSLNIIVLCTLIMYIKPLSEPFVLAIILLNRQFIHIIKTFDMIEKLDSGQFRITVNVRECFLYTVDFKYQQLIFVYVNRTDDFTYVETFEFKKFSDKDWIYKDSLDDVIELVSKSIDYYLNNNIISASVRRAWIKFKDEYCAALHSAIMLNFKI